MASETFLIQNLEGRFMVLLDTENKMDKPEEPFLKVENLVTQFFTQKGIVKALDGVSLSIRKGEVLGLVGESGCGKSVTATSIMDLIIDPPGRIVQGKIFVDGFNIIGDLKKLATIKVKSDTNVKIKRRTKLIKRHNTIISKIRGNKIAMIFQEPGLALNPVLTIGDQISEAILLHSRVNIANSIIRRETINETQVADFVQSVQSKSSLAEKESQIHTWTRDYGVPDLESSLRDLFISTDEEATLAKEIRRVIEEAKTFPNVQQMVTARDYFKLEDQLVELNLQLLEAENTGNRDALNNIEAKVSNLKGELNRNFSSYRFTRRFLKRRAERPFKDAARRRGIELLEMVNISDPVRVYDAFPHELSGGMQQRAMIAMALSANPKMLIADEPTTALDVTTQAQILDLIRDLRTFTGSSILFITHDLAVIAEMCDRVGVMYAGNLVEEAPVADIFSDPKHPYTTGLLASLPRIDQKLKPEEKLPSIQGSVPNLITPPTGCRFHPRCQFKMDICSVKKPKLVELEGQTDRKVACFLYSEESEETYAAQ